MVSRLSRSRRRSRWRRPVCGEFIEDDVGARAQQGQVGASAGCQCPEPGGGVGFAEEQVERCAGRDPFGRREFGA